VAEDPLADLLDSRPLGVCLDLASGPGAFTARLAQLGEARTWLRLDLEPALLGPRGAGAPGIALAGRAERVPLRDGSLDTVAISYSLHHLPRPRRVLLEALRLLRPGGRLIVSEPLADGLSARQRLHRDLHHLSARLDRRLGRCHNPTWRLRDLRRLLEGLPLTWRQTSWRPPETGPGDPSLAPVWETLERLERELLRRRQPGARTRLAQLGREIRRTGFGSQTQFLAVGEKP
jgi:SAM-dependent methyltransferase